MPETPQKNKNGCIIERSFIAGGSRYQFDFNTCKAEDGWLQFDTDQDDWYFGVWVHPGRREIITYAEGDITHVTCETDEQYRAEMQDMFECYRAAPAFISIDTDKGQVTEHYQDRAVFLP